MQARSGEAVLAADGLAGGVSRPAAACGASDGMARSGGLAWERRASIRRRSHGEQ